MFVPIVPVIPYTSTTVVNKTIVYSDTVLPLKEIGNNLKVTSISNISEYSLESCLKKIFESNPDVVFNTIQYSKNDKKVYFYTNNEISTKEYEESKFIKYKPITNKTEILEEIKNVLLSEKNNDSDCITLYDVAQLVKNIEKKYDKLKENYANKFDSILKPEFGRDALVTVYDFKYDEEVLMIGFMLWFDADSTSDKIQFKKENGDLYISKSNCYNDNKIFKMIYSDLNKLYEEFMKFKEYKDYLNRKENIASVNSNFKVNISSYGTAIFTNYCGNDFKLFSPSYSNDYKLDCNSGIINQAFYGSEDEIFKRIFVKIDDCPEWAKASLYEIRQNQLAEERRIEEEREIERKKIEQELKRREEKKQKRLELKRKFFPWIKK